MATRELAATIDRCLADFDFRGATDAVCSVVDQVNKLINREEPWLLARREQAGEAAAGGRLSGLLDRLVAGCRVVADELEPFVPDGAAELRRQLGQGAAVGEPIPVFPRLAVPG